MSSLEMISEFVPNKHKQLINHIRKTDSRHKRKLKEKRQQKLINDDHKFPVTKKSSKPTYFEILIVFICCLIVLRNYCMTAKKMMIVRRQTRGDLLQVML